MASSLPDATKQRFAGGDANLKFNTYKIGCEDEVEFFKRRLQYERKGTALECLRRGYGQGTQHVRTENQSRYLRQDDVRDENDTAAQQEAVFAKWDIPLGYWPPERSAFDMRD